MVEGIITAAEKDTENWPKMLRQIQWLYSNDKPNVTREDLLPIYHPSTEACVNLATAINDMIDKGATIIVMAAPTRLFKSQIIRKKQLIEAESDMVIRRKMGDFFLQINIRGKNIRAVIIKIFVADLRFIQHKFIIMPAP